MVQQTELQDILILVKTYPQPSRKHREITCVAAITANGELRRLFPVTYCLLEGEQQFKKWEWIKARVHKASNDHRPESYRIDVDSIQRPGNTIDTSNEWAKRQHWIEPHLVASFDDLEQRRQKSGETLGIIRSKSLLGLDITPEKEIDWTTEERTRLEQDGLFDRADVRNRVPLRKLPYAFHYRYECHTPNGLQQHRHLITDWEVGALYWNCYRSHGSQWEEPFRQKLEQEFAQKDLMFIMGTMHRFPDQWLIIGLIYPSRRTQEMVTQHRLALGDE
ncbi:MAG: hypothetical protein HC837_01695 [Chloroflexaceae bacterium]|nr:hypothetical protein [Chloroflexaceae bacterium]